MPVALLPFALWFGLAAATASPQAPAYSVASIVNAADNETATLAPNTIATIYGTGLAWVTRAIGPNDVHGGTLPTVLSGTGVHVIVGGIVANIYYVSPSQINFLVPASLLPAASNVQVVLDSTCGPLVPVQIAAASPALFQLDAQNAIATRPDGSLLTPDSPASAGDIVILYATGLGQTVPTAEYSQLPTQAASLQLAGFEIMLDGSPVDPAGILYAGIAPGFAGLYQINLIIPAATGPNPEIRIGFDGTLSKPGLRLPVGRLLGLETHLYTAYSLSVNMRPDTSPGQGREPFASIALRCLPVDRLVMQNFLCESRTSFRSRRAPYLSSGRPHSAGEFRGSLCLTRYHQTEGRTFRDSRC